MRSLSLLLAATVLVACAPTALPSPRTDPVSPSASTLELSALPSAAPSPTLETDPEPTPWPTGPFDLLGRVSGVYGLCPTLTDDDHRRWEIKWANEYELTWEEKEPVLLSPSGEVVARRGDRIRIRGTLGWYAEGKVLVKFRPGHVDPETGFGGDVKARRAAVRAWVGEHGLRLERSYGNGRSYWWSLTIVDGMSAEAKAAELSVPAVVDTAVRVAQGSFCMVGLPFTATSVEILGPEASGT